MRQRKPLKRSAKPIARRTRVKQKRATPRRSSRELDPAYLAKVRCLPCAAAGRLDTSCSGDMEAHHMGARGLGQKCSDYEAVPFCTHHHRSWHDCSGVFVTWSKVARTAYAEACIAATQAALGYGEHVGGPYTVIDMELL